MLIDDICRFKRTENFNEYVDLLIECRQKYLIILSVKDTPGDMLNSNAISKLHDLGFINFTNQLWRMYAGISIDGCIALDKAGNKAEETVEHKLDSQNVSVYVKSSAWRKENKAQIIIDGVDYAVNIRGINIVVYDTVSQTLVDSIGYDAHNSSDGVFKRNEIYMRSSANSNFRTDIKNFIISRPVIIWGNESSAEKFILKHGNKLDIRMVVTGKKAEIGESIGVWRTTSYKEQKIPNGAYFIVCRENVQDWDATKKFLSEKHLLLNDFVRFDLADAILSDKKIITFVGYCQQLGTMQVLNHCKAFNEKYYARHFHIDRNTKKNDYNFSEFVAFVKLADILCHVPLFSSDGLIDIDINKTIGENCIKISFPRIPFRGFAPYKSSNLRQYNTDTRLFGKIRYPFLYEETIFNKLIKEGKSTEEIYNIVSDENLYTYNEVKKNFDLGMKMVEIASQQCDLKIYDYIRDNIRAERLFRDGLHFENRLFFECASRLSKLLGVDCESELADYEQECREKDFHFQVATQVPILPSVAKHLGIEHLASPKMKYQIKVTDDGKYKYLNFKEWVYAYVNYTRSAITINDIISLVK